MRGESCDAVELHEMVSGLALQTTRHADSLSSVAYHVIADSNLHEKSSPDDCR